MSKGKQIHYFDKVRLLQDEVSQSKAFVSRYALAQSPESVPMMCIGLVKEVQGNNVTVDIIFGDEPNTVTARVHTTKDKLELAYE